MLPGSVQEVWIKNLTLAGDSLDLTFRRYETDVGVNVVRKTRQVETVITK